MVGRLIWRPLLLLVCLVLCSNGIGFAAKVTAFPDRNQVVEGESFQLDLRVEGNTDGDPDLRVIEERFDILGRSQSSQMNFINGDFNRSLVLSLTLMPRSSGVQQVPAVCFGRDCSQPLKINVLPAGSQSGDDGGADDLLLVAEAGPERVYVQGQVLLKVQLLSRVDLLQASLSEPQFEGVETVAQRLGEDRQFQVMRDGYRYQAIERRYALFPQQSGTLRIAPLQFNGQIADAARRRFDMFPRGGRQVRKYSKPVEIRVEAAPDTALNQDWLPALSLELIDDWQGKNLEMTVGEPLTRTLTLRATGLPSAQLPQIEFDVPSQFKLYPDQPSRKDFSSDAGIVGSLEQKLALVPTQAGHFQIPAIQIDWWDVSSRQWHTATVPSVSVEVKAAAGVISESSAPKTGLPAGMVHEPTVDQADDRQIVQTVVRDPGFWPWITLVIGAGWIMTLALLIKGRREKVRSEEQGNDVVLTEKQAYRHFQQALKGKDPRHIRVELLNYIRATGPTVGISNLEQFATRTGEPLKSELQKLNAILYGGGETLFEPQSLERAFEQWRSTIGVEQKHAVLPELYPPK